MKEKAKSTRSLGPHSRISLPSFADNLTHRWPDILGGHGPRGIKLDKDIDSLEKIVATIESKVD